MSEPLVSSWEHRTRPVLPPPRRLAEYARFLATPRSLEGGGRLVTDLTAEEDQRRIELQDELHRLRAAALSDGPALAARTRRRFWRFDDDLPIRIITTKLSRRALTSVPARPDPSPADTNDPSFTVVPYADPAHPNHIETLWDGDAPSTREVFGELRAQNPDTDVSVLLADQVDESHFTGHIVVLGGGDLYFEDPRNSPDPRGSVLTWLVRRHDLPWFVRFPAGGDDEFDSEWVVPEDADGTPLPPSRRGQRAREQVYRPSFTPGPSGLPDDRLLVGGYPQLEYDVAVLARMPNRLNTAATLTICTGIFSRGSNGAVRALTDRTLREGNEAWLAENVDPRNFWMLLRVPAFGAGAITPDLQRDYHTWRVESPIAS